MVFPVIFLLMLIFWIYAEKKNLSFAARMGGGLACMVFIGLTINFMSQIIPHYESVFHKQNMWDIEHSLTNGDTMSALQALHTYNSIASTGSTYSAAIEMREVIHPLKLS